MARYKSNTSSSPRDMGRSSKADSPSIKREILPTAKDVIDETSLPLIEEALIDRTRDIIDLDLWETIISKTFGRPDDTIELHIYNLANKLLYSEYN